MLVSKVENVKDFMNQLLKKEMFHDFLVRDMSLTTFVQFEIHGALNQGYYDSVEEYENLERSFCLWSEIQHHAFELIKGNKPPKNIKIVFSARDELIAMVNDGASALFINITFDSNGLLVTTGSAQKSFSLDKSIEFMWDEWVTQFFIRNGITLIEQME